MIGALIAAGGLSLEMTSVIREPVDALVSHMTRHLQSLALSIDEFMLRQVEYFEERLKNAGDSENGSHSRLVRACLLVNGRLPSVDELGADVVFVRQNGLFAMCRAVLNSDEFLYVDCAWKDTF